AVAHLGPPLSRLMNEHRVVRDGPDVVVGVVGAEAAAVGRQRATVEDVEGVLLVMLVPGEVVAALEAGPDGVLVPGRPHEDGARPAFEVRGPVRGERTGERA